MAIHSRPLPTYPQAPLPPKMNYATNKEHSLKPNPLIPIRLPVLSGPVLLNNFLLDLFGAGKGGKRIGIIGEEMDGNGGMGMEEGTGGWVGIRRGVSVSSGLGMSVGGLNGSHGPYVSSSVSALRSGDATHTRVRGKKLD